MELPPIEQERLLVELAPHSCEHGYLARRLDALSLTSNGALYLRHCRRERIVGKVRLALEVAGSPSAIITLVLTILSAVSASTVP